MEQIIFNKAQCTGCGICVDICPYRAIVVENGTAENIQKDCFLCGQCQAACPENAISLPKVPLTLGLTTIKETVDVVPPGTTSPSELVTLMRSRRSCRRYLRRPIEIYLLEDLVKIGTTAPSGTNSQSWNFVIVPSREDLQILGGKVADYYRRLNRLAANPLLRIMIKIFGDDSLGRYYRKYHDSIAEALQEWDERASDRLFHGATAAILVSGKKEASCPAEDALLASQNILLAAHTMGLGSCLIGFAVEAIRRDKKLKRLVGITGDDDIYSVIALGYPAVSYRRPANRKAVLPRILKLAEGYNQQV